MSSLDDILRCGQTASEAAYISVYKVRLLELEQDIHILLSHVLRSLLVEPELGIRGGSFSKPSFPNVNSIIIVITMEFTPGKGS